MRENWYDLNGISKVFLRNTIAFGYAVLVSVSGFLFFENRQTQKELTGKIEKLYSDQIKYVERIATGYEIQKSMQSELEKIKEELKKCSKRK